MSSVLNAPAAASAPAATSTSVTIGHYLNGQTVVPARGRSQAVFNPATGAVSGHVALASADDVDAAVASAKAALAAWSELLISLFGFYAAGAIFLNNFFGRVVFPLGAPFGFIQKGALKPVSTSTSRGAFAAAGDRAA